MQRFILAITTLSALIATPAAAIETRLQLVIELPGDAQRQLVKYKCDQASDLVEVEYLNASPNFLAITEVDGEKLIFARTLSGSGVRYTSGQYIWWTKGAEANLFDQTLGPDASPIVTCIEANDIP